MSILKQVFWLLLFSFLGEALSPIVKLPGSVLGLLLLFFCLHFKILPVEEIEDVATWLSQNMAFIFIPAGVGLINHLDLLSEQFWSFAIIILVTTVLVMVLVGRLVQTLRARKGGGSNDVD